MLLTYRLKFPLASLLLQQPIETHNCIIVSWDLHLQSEQLRNCITMANDIGSSKHSFKRKIEDNPEKPNVSPSKKTKTSFRKKQVGLHHRNHTHLTTMSCNVENRYQPIKVAFKGRSNVINLFLNSINKQLFDYK